MKEYAIQQIIHNDRYQFVDVRSPSEYMESHIPGAIHLPLFTDQEREEIGTIYKKQGPDQAKWRAMEVVSPKIPSLMEQLRHICSVDRKPVIYCWRGGMRSKAVTTFATMVGLPAARLIGGFKAYRQYILEQLGPNMIPDTVIVLHGLTGIGKTELLRQLDLRGWPVLDLELLANHRGSVFGEFGHWQAHNQKTFDSLLFHRLYELKNEPLLLVEAESKRMGKILLPDSIIEAKENGIHLLLTAELPIRVERIYQEYVAPFKDEPWFKERLENAVQVIQKRMSNALRAEIAARIQMEDYKSFIQLILTHYYDPMYAHKQKEYQKQFQVIDITDLEKGIREVEHFLQPYKAMTSTV